MIEFEDKSSETYRYQAYKFHIFKHSWKILEQIEIWLKFLQCDLFFVSFVGPTLMPYGIKE